jgi:2-oxoisovalerate dehydrogenase E1 component alpha subunit
MSFSQPSTFPAMPTYRVLNSNGEIVDNARGPPDVSDEEVLTWYTNMLTGAYDRTGACVWQEWC